ncbi:hypothetical protein, partial [Conservatibacter flavescens]
MVATISKTQKIELNSSSVHIQDRYYLVIGFEVNKPEVYNELILEDDYDSSVKITVNMHDVLSDPGHAFMYLVKNKSATIFFSLGPIINDSERLLEINTEQRVPTKVVNALFRHNPIATTLAYVAANAKQRMYGRGTSDYRIPEKTKLFKFPIKQEQYSQLYERTRQYKNDIENGVKFYNITNNFTCASVVREIIGTTIPDFPWGRSAVLIGHIRAINPYALYQDVVTYASDRGISEVEISESVDIWDQFITDIRNNQELPL